MTSHARRLAENFRAFEEDETIPEEKRQKARRRRLELQATAEIAEKKDVDEDDVLILSLQQRQEPAGSTAKYAIDGEPGIEFHSIGDADEMATDGGREIYPEEEYHHLLDLEVTESAMITIGSDLLFYESNLRDTDGLEMGVSVLQDGDWVAISAGTVDESETPHIWTSHGLTPDQARDLAEALETGAERAEQAQQWEEDTHQTGESVLSRLHDRFFSGGSNR